MKKLLTAMGVIFALTCLTQSFTPAPAPASTTTTATQNRPAFIYEKFMASLWAKPQQAVIDAPRLASPYTVVVNNFWAVNVRINYIAVGNPWWATDYCTGNFPIEPGDNTNVFTEASGNTVYVGITIVGPPEDPNTEINLSLETSTSGTLCLPVTGSGDYVFHNAMFKVPPGASSLGVDNSGCH